MAERLYIDSEEQDPLIGDRKLYIDSEEQIQVNFVLKALFNADDQSLSNGQVLDTPAEGVEKGHLNVVEVDGTLAIASSKLAFTAQSTPVWGDQGVYSQAITRDLGVGLFGTLNRANTTEQSIHGFSDAANVSLTDGLYHIVLNAVGQILVRTDNAVIENIVVGAYSASTDYEFIEVLGGYDSNGVPYQPGDVKSDFLYGASLFVRGGAYTDFTLLWKTPHLNTSTLYSTFSNYDAVGTLDNFEVPKLPLNPDIMFKPLALDTFTDTNGTALTAHTPDVDSVGGGWVVTGSGTAEIQGNKLVNTSAIGGNNATAIIDTGSADIFYGIDITPTTSFAAILLRHSDSSNNWDIQLATSSDEFRLRSQIAGVIVTHSVASVTINAGTSYHIDVICKRETITAYIDGGNKIEYASASFNKTETKIGALIDNVSGNTGSVDNFTVYPLTSTAIDAEITRRTGGIY